MRGCLLFVAAVSGAMTLTVHAQAPAPATPESLVKAAKRAAGHDYAGTFLRICVAPDNLAAPRRAGALRRPPPARCLTARTWYAKPYKVFDNLYFVGTKIHSAWALTTTDGIIVIDTLFDYAIEPEIVEGLTTLGLDPRNIKYVLISHAHGDHDQGAALLQSRYGAKIVMGAADWDVDAAASRVCARRRAEARRRRRGRRHEDHARRHDRRRDRHAGSHAGYAVVHLPGQGRGTHGDGGVLRRHGVQLSAAGGELRRLPRQPAEDGGGGGAAGATVLMTNHTEFDRAYDRVRIAQLPRAAGEKHPYETDAATVQRYFEMGADCAEAQRLSMQ